MTEPEKDIITELLLQASLTDKEIRAILKLVSSEDAIEQEKAIQSMKGKTPYNKQVLYNMLKEYIPEKAPKEEEPKETIIETSMINNGSRLYEQIHDEEGNDKFVTLENGEIKYYSGIGNEEGTFIPITGNCIKEGAVTLPTDLEHFGSLEGLIADIQNHIHRYLDVSEDFEIFATYYVLLSWVYDSITTLPYLRALGDTGTGKSRFLSVIGGICYKPCKIAGAITPAPIYRMIDKFHGTLLIDEADMKDSDTYNEVIKILNCGFEKGTPVIRCDKDNPSDLEFFPTFCPKLICTRQTFYDKALESRCLNEIMRQTGRKDIPSILPEDFYNEQKHLRNRLLYFRFIYRNQIDNNVIQKIDLGDIEPRLKQATGSFAVLFANIPDLFDRFKAFLVKYQKDLVEERAGSFEGRIINALFDLMGGIRESEVSEVLGESYISAKDILGKLEEGGDTKSTPSSIGRKLKALGLVTKFYKKEGRRIIDMSNIEQIKALFKRYVLPDMSDTLDTTDTNESPKQDHQERLDEEL